MKLYVMDTDIAGFAFQRHPTVQQRIQSLLQDDLIVTTIITFGEDLGGWLPACHRAVDGDARSRAYARLQRGLDFYRRWLACRLTQPLLQSLTSCERRGYESEQTILQSPPSRCRPAAFCLHATQ